MNLEITINHKGKKQIQVKGDPSIYVRNLACDVLELLLSSPEKEIYDGDIIMQVWGLKKDFYTRGNLITHIHIARTFLRKVNKEKGTNYDITNVQGSAHYCLTFKN